MKYLNKETDVRIEKFLNKKDMEFPELALRGGERRAETIGHVIADTILDSIASLKFKLSR